MKYNVSCSIFYDVIAAAAVPFFLLTNRQNIQLFILFLQNSSTGAAHCGKVAEEDQHLTMEDLLYALQETRPSVSKGELHKYKRM